MVCYTHGTGIMGSPKNDVVEESFIMYLHKYVKNKIQCSD